MDGFVPQRTIYTLAFDDPAMAGLVIRARRVTLGEWIEYDTLVGNEDVLTFVTKTIIKWNLQHEDGTPVPTTYEGLLTQENQFIKTIHDAWRNAVFAVPAPLEQPSNDGASVEEASIPMEPLPESLAS